MNKTRVTILLPSGERITARAAIRRENKKKKEAKEAGHSK